MLPLKNHPSIPSSHFYHHPNLHITAISIYNNNHSCCIEVNKHSHFKSSSQGTSSALETFVLPPPSAHLGYALHHHMLSVKTSSSTTNMHVSCSWSVCFLVALQEGRRPCVLFPACSWVHACSACSYGTWLLPVSLVQVVLKANCQDSSSLYYHCFARREETLCFVSGLFVGACLQRLLLRDVIAAGFPGSGCSQSQLSRLFKPLLPLFCKKGGDLVFCFRPVRGCMLAAPAPSGRDCCRFPRFRLFSKPTVNSL